jgi:hypothetical protein
MSRKTVWKDEYLFDAYELTRQGAGEKAISQILGVAFPTFANWEQKKPLFRMALKKGRRIYQNRVGNHESEIADFVYNGLSADMKKVWKRLSRAANARSPKKVMDAILEGKGKAFRQYLFIFAFVTGNYRVTDACRKVGVSVRTFNAWKESDPEFMKLFRDVMEAKKDLCEDHLLRLVKEGSDPATIFSVKTLCKDRGYGEKMSVDVNVSGQVNHNVLSFEKLRPYLSSGAQMEILEALRKTRQIEGEERTAIPSRVVPQIEGRVLEGEFISNGD